MQQLASGGALAKFRRGISLIKTEEKPESP
jgi:hypothetical protein